LPQAQWIFVSSYFGWIPSFMLLLLYKFRLLKKFHLLLESSKRVIAAYKQSTPHSLLIDSAHLKLFEQPEKSDFSSRPPNCLIIKTLLPAGE